MRDTAPPGRAALAALFSCPLSCQDDGSHFRVQALVAGQDSRDYAAPASVAVCMHISRWKMMVVRWECGSCLGSREPALSSCGGHMGLAGQLSFSFHHSLPMLPLPQAQSGDEDMPFYWKRIWLSVDDDLKMNTVISHCLEMTDILAIQAERKLVSPPHYPSPFLPMCLLPGKSYFIADLFSSVFQHRAHCQINSSALPVKSFHSFCPESSIKFVCVFWKALKYITQHFDSLECRDCEGEGESTAGKNAPFPALKFFVGTSANRNSCLQRTPIKISSQPYIALSFKLSLFIPNQCHPLPFLLLFSSVNADCDGACFTIISEV